MKDFIVDIEHVIEGNKVSVKSNTLISPSEVDKYLKGLGFDRVEFDSNGWDWDFWAYYETESGDEFVLSGSGWYNTGLEFSRKNK